MLHEAKGLAEGPLQLALQVYACKASGKPLPLPGRHTESFKAAKLAAALEEGFDRSEQLELRSFILQVRLCCWRPSEPVLLIIIQGRLGYHSVLGRSRTVNSGFLSARKCPSSWHWYAPNFAPWDIVALGGCIGSVRPRPVLH